jgi:ferritin-like metal-binding protein YciE
MSLKTLQDLYKEELKDIYSAENQLIKALPNVAKGSTDPKLQKAIRDHLGQTEQHAKRIEDIFKDLEGKPAGKHCKAMEGLLEEGAEVLKEDGADEVRDAALIGAAQRVEHYEMAAYGTARAHAELLGYSEHAKILQMTLDEEEAANDKLTEIAESSVNQHAQMVVAE